ncbi:HTH domain-containing protein [Corallococcus sicarius]|uniref:HTH HARE-type domain-containing protein n=1 Tax=Corallococcus sicarius TaxID=2316726 RepID=A0A3A8NFF1_9BACT|nr:HTH domain-containing protein [Corallococcus sicarius]RKH38642.1 hypothetical protein D7X12_25845 [Corallococcus sicarius]
MTFYEAALRVLESEGRPLHFLEITEKSIQQSLLSHIGKTPEVTMLSRLAAMARRTRDRKVIVTAKDTFALTDWSLSEDAEALAQTGVMEPHPEEELPPLRPVERHPEPRTDNVRASGRGTERKRRRDEGDEERGRRKRFPPLPEVVFEILSEADVGLRTDQIIERAKAKELCAEETTVEAVLTALLEDNQRRIDAGRRPQYAFNQESGEVSLERAGAPSEAPPLELQAAFAQALGIPLEGGRPVLGKPVPGVVEPLVDEALIATARTALKDARRSVARGLRKRLGEADVGTFEKSVVKMMHGLGFRELKVAKRSKEGPLLTARKREGSVELRYAVRMLKGMPGVDRKTVQELRRDLGHYSAQVGLLVSAGEVRGDARSEAQATGSLVMLWCGDALGEKFLEAKTGVNVTQVELYDIDERFFEAAKLDAEEAQRRREERKSEKQAREEGGEVEVSATTTSDRPEREERPERSDRPERGDRQERAERRRDRQRARNEARDAAAAAPSAEAAEPKASPVAAAPPAAAGFTPSSDEDDSDEGDDEGEDDDLEAASAFVGGAKEGAEGGTAESNASERKRRRRRRRGRRGRGTRGAEGGPAGEPGAPVTGEAVAASGEIAAPTAGGIVEGEGQVALAGEALPVVVGVATEASTRSPDGEAAVIAPSEGNAWHAGEAVRPPSEPESPEAARARAEAAQAASDAVTPAAGPALSAEEASEAVAAGEAAASPGGQPEEGREPSTGPVDPPEREEG